VIHADRIREARDVRGAGRLACLDPEALAAALDLAECRRMTAFNRGWARRCRDAGDLATAADKSARARWWDRRALEMLADPRPQSQQELAT
jgi:hypothetical protein